MSQREKFTEAIISGYTSKGESIVLGAAMLNGEAIKEAKVTIPLRTLNRHGLIAGATGTGKTKTIQKLAEELSKRSVPVLMMDIKGDFSGISKPGEMSDKLKERIERTGITLQPEGFPVEFLSLSQQPGVRLRATVTEFGPVLFSRMLGLNDTQSGVVALVFKYCDDHQLPLLDLKDFRKVIQYLTNEGRSEIEKEYGKISTATTGTIIRKVVELEQQGAERFFGEKSFEVDDLTRIDENGKGIISIVRLTDIQDKPKLFSTFMLSLLAEVYSSFPEEGDLDAPKLVIFIDEAHLVFEEASKAVLDQLEAIIKLIRSKGVGIFFCTQNPSDIPSSILAQLGLKIQHALRAFTAADRKTIKQAAENYPETEFYKTDELLTQLGIGEAFVTALNEKGIPSPLAATLIAPPASRMDVLTQEELDKIIAASPLVKKYNTDVDPESAYELLTKKLEAASAESSEASEGKQEKTPKRSAKEEKSTMEKMLNSPVSKQIGRTVVRELTRGLLGVLGLGGRSRRKKGSFF